MPGHVLPPTLRPIDGQLYQCSRAGMGVQPSLQAQPEAITGLAYPHGEIALAAHRFELALVVLHPHELLFDHAKVRTDAALAAAGERMSGVCHPAGRRQNDICHLHSSEDAAAHGSC